ncbi:MAG: RibD family protein, partial [Planctomycetota bacterium]
LSPASRLVATAREVPVLCATTEAAPAPRLETLERAGVEPLVLPADAEGRVAMAALMQELGRRRMTNVLLEGGGEVFASALAAGLVDKLLVFVAPRLIGGRDAPSPVAGRGVARVAEALAARDLTTRRLGEDLLLEAWL